MTIFLSFLQSKNNYPIPSYSFWEYYIKNGIEEAEHQWVECKEIDWAYGLVPQSTESLSQWKSKCWEQTIEYLKTNPVDLFLSYLYPHQIDVSAVSEIQKIGIPCVNFFCDNVREFTQVPKEFKVFDLNWIPEFKALPMYKYAGVSAIHLPMPMWVAPKNRTLPVIENSRISFIGSRDIQRQMLFESVLKKNSSLELDIYGAGWKNDTFNHTKTQGTTYSFTEKFLYQINFIKSFGINAYKRKIKQRKFQPELDTSIKKHIFSQITFEEYTKITKESMITMGVNRYPSFKYPLTKPNHYSRLRDIEAPMLGACYLTEWTEGIDELYDLGTEIEVYKTTEDLLSKIDYLKHTNAKRNQLRVNGQRRALEKNAIPVSISKIITCL